MWLKQYPQNHLKWVLRNIKVWLVYDCFTNIVQQTCTPLIFHHGRRVHPRVNTRQLDPVEALQDFPEDALSSAVQLARDAPVMYSELGLELDVGWD